MNITPVNNFNLKNNRSQKQAFGANLGNMEDLIVSINGLNHLSDDFFRELDKNANKTRQIRYGKLQPTIHVELNQRNEAIKPFNFIVFSDLSENLSGDALFQYKPKQTVEQNLKRFIAAMKRATRNIKDQSK
jgi:hypothetical protein